MDEVSSWCSLPKEILSLIVSHLLGADFVVFYAVCKWWRKTPPPITRPNYILNFTTPSVEPPFLLMLPGNKLFHPIYKYSHHIQVYEEFPRAYIRASYSGWLLMTLSKCCIFFFNPFTKEKVELADLSTPYQPKLTFIFKPSSPDCLVFGIQQRPENREEIKIYTIKPGQSDWKIQTIDCTHFRLSSSRPIFFKGQFYCLGNGGMLLIYDPEDDTYRWVGPPNPPIRSGLGFQYYMVKSKGKLLLVYTDREGHSVNVARLDASKRAVWEKIDNLGDTMLFVSYMSSFSVTSTVRGFGNKIYFPRFGGDDKLLFYSLATHKYHCFDGGHIRNKFDNTKFYPNSTWIKPCHSC